ncbi:MAG: UDP-2,3-diacylglucosamine diphosphatase [Gammaproteobacteria bacterium]|nr:UDP-2,3-diacylglucosamine diphosphatase [Gammaproteobacteria bacterium]
MTTLFISDLHLQAPRPDLTELFLALLKEHAGHVEALYILGDLFETWIGDDDQSAFNTRILLALRQFTDSGSRLYFLPGNRDFLIGNQFLEKTNCVLLSDPTLIDLYGEQVLLLHGDNLCTDDKKHQLFRKITQHALFKKSILSIPLSWRQKIAETLRSWSQTHTKKLAPKLMDATPLAIKTLFNRYHVDVLIHGHTHRPSIEYFYESSPQKEKKHYCSRIVLSDWETQAHMLIWNKQGKRLMFLPKPEIHTTPQPLPITRNTPPKHSSRLSFMALLAGALTPFAFAPYAYWPLAILCPTLLLFTLTTSLSQEKKSLHFVSRQLILTRGFLFGIGLFGVGTSWVFISIHTYGNTSFFISSLITLLFVWILALFPTLHAFLTSRLPFKSLWLSFPVTGALVEWLRSWFFSGFPWLQLGQSQTHGPFKGFVPLLGNYGVSFLLLLCSVLLFLVLRLQKWRAGLFLLFILFSGAALSFIHWTTPSGETLRVSLTQGNIPQEIKWSPEQLRPTLETYLALTQPHLDSRIIFWPEGAVPLPLPQAAPFLTDLSELAKQHHTSIVLGLPVEVGFSYYNSLVSVGDLPFSYSAALAREETLHSTHFYHKRHLVPFGEYVPLASLLRGLIGFFDLPMSDFLAGPSSQPLLEADGAKLGAFICYEVAYSNLLYHTLKQNPDFLVTLSNDAWFGESWAPYQHAQIAQFAALLTGRYMVLDANSGKTAIYDEKGHELKSLPLFTREVLTGTLVKVTGFTPWDHYGDTPILMILTGLYFFCFLKKRDRGKT